MSSERPASSDGETAAPVYPRPDITITLGCNNQCSFCPRSTLRHIQVRSTADRDQRLQALRKHSKRVVLTGGEVTLLPELCELVSHCRSLGFEQIGIITNGRALADLELARQLVDGGLTEACVTVYDLRSQVHDQLTGRAGSLVETLQGLDHLLTLAQHQPSLLVRINTLLCVANVDGLHELLRELSSRGVRRFLVGNVLLSEAYAEALDHRRVREVARAVATDPALAAATTQWRGFPPCLLADVPGIEVEPHDIDTAVVEESDFDAYVTEFAERFTHVDACQRCGSIDSCVGVQKRYLAQYPPTHIRPLDVDAAAKALEAARQELADFPPWAESGRLEIMPTTACPFRCTYCAVKLGRQDASPQVLDRAVDLLLTSRHERLELQFFGGEPLVRRREVLRIMARAASLARERHKHLRFVITTSGLLLDAGVLSLLRRFDVKVMFSFDGPPDVMSRYRPLAQAGPDVIPRLEHNLRLLVRSGVPYFVNMVATPEDAADLPRRFGYIADLGARTIQVCYALGSGWTEQAQAGFCDALRRCAELVASREGPPVRMQNFGSAAEPTVLSNDLLLDVDGTLYGDAALFGERVFPGARPAFRIGSVLDLESFDGLRRSREQNLVALRQTYPDETCAERQILEQQVAFGRRIQQTLDDIGTPRPGPHPPPAERDRNPLQKTVLRRSLAHQARVMRQRPQLLPLPLLMLENPCVHDCVFCLSKPLEPTGLEPVLRWLADNRELGLTRLGLAGNEPLAHPHIDRILAEARHAGFERFEVLSSGSPLADPKRVRALFDLGVRGFAMPLYAADAAVHDGITQSPGSHQDTLGAIETLRELGADVHVHANLLSHNLDHLQALEALVRDRWELPLCVIPIRPKASNLPYAELMPRYADIIERARVRSLVAFPLCVAAKVQDPVRPSGSLISDLLKIYVLDQPFIKPERCQPCRWRSRCSGTFQAYLELHGSGDLEPQ